MPTNIFAVDCDLITCPGGSLGAASAMDINCDPNLNQSEINSLIMTHPTLGDLVTNWGPGLVVGDFDIDNTDATNVKQKRFFGIGDLAASEALTVTTNNFNSNVLMRTFTLNFSIFDLSPATYDYFRKLQCSTVKPLLWFTTVAQKIKGKDGGISLTSITVDTPLERGEESVERIDIVMTWKAKTSPDSYDSPLP